MSSQQPSPTDTDLVDQCSGAAYHLKSAATSTRLRHFNTARRHLQDAGLILQYLELHLPHDSEEAVSRHTAQP